MEELKKRLGELYDRATNGENRIYYYFTVSYENPNDVGEIFTAADANLTNPDREIFGCFGGEMPESKETFIENLLK